MLLQPISGRIASSAKLARRSAASSRVDASLSRCSSSDPFSALAARSLICLLRSARFWRSVARADFRPITCPSTNPRPCSSSPVYHVSKVGGVGGVSPVPLPWATGSGVPPVPAPLSAMRSIPPRSNIIVASCADSSPLYRKGMSFLSIYPVKRKPPKVTKTPRLQSRGSDVYFVRRNYNVLHTSMRQVFL